MSRCLRPNKFHRTFTHSAEAAKQGHNFIDPCLNSQMFIFFNRKCVTDHLQSAFSSTHQPFYAARKNAQQLPTNPLAAASNPFLSYLSTCIEFDTHPGCERSPPCASLACFFLFRDSSKKESWEHKQKMRLRTSGRQPDATDASPLLLPLSSFSPHSSPAARGRANSSRINPDIVPIIGVLKKIKVKWVLKSVEVGSTAIPSWEIRTLTV